MLLRIRKGLFQNTEGTLKEAKGTFQYSTGTFQNIKGILHFNTGFLFFNRGFYQNGEGFYKTATETPLPSPRTRSRTFANRPYPTLKPKFAKELALLTAHKAKSNPSETDKKAHPQKIKTLNKLYSTMGIEKSNIRYENINPLYCHSTMTIKSQLLTHGSNYWG